MYNLLAVVVSVAIGVFMAGAGVFYAGSAFTTASGKAQAMQIISNMEQIDAAWTMWNNDGNLTSTTAPISTNLTGTPNYLSSYPPAPSIAILSGLSGVGVTTPSYQFDLINAATPESPATGIFIVLNHQTGGNACLEIARSSGLLGTSATFSGPNPVVGGTTITLSGITTPAEMNALIGAYRFFCVQLGLQTPGAVQVGGQSFTGGLASANVANDGGKYFVYFKHQ